MTDTKKLADLLQSALDADLSGPPYVRLSRIFVKELEMVLRSITQPEELRREPTEGMIEAGADAFLQAKDAWQAAQPKNFGATCPLMVTLPAAYKAMVAQSPHRSAEEK